MMRADWMLSWTMRAKKPTEISQPCRIATLQSISWDEIATLYSAAISVGSASKI